MGCYPLLGKMVNKAFCMCRGKERRRGASRGVILSPPPSYLYSRPRTMMKSVSFANETPIIIIPPNSSQTVTMPKPRPKENHPNNVAATTAVTISVSATAKADSTEPTRLKFEEPNRDHSSTGSDPNKAGSSPKAPSQPEPTPAQRDPPPCYVMSPLPRWEDLPRRREYFSAEYNYYPTPIREGIYSIATDPNRLTTIFSEENPNACSIV